MVLKFPPSISKRIDLQNYLKERSLFETIIYWMIDWKTRRSVKLKSWINVCLNEKVLDDIIKDNSLSNIKDWSNTRKVKRVLQLVNKSITYKRDKDVWDCGDKWQRPAETWNLKTGDCEDGAILIYCLLNKLGVPDRLLRIACGDVDGGGHAYVVFRSDEDSLEYPVDWCYWYRDSVGIRTPYVIRNEYFNGKKEWFSFNSHSSYRPIK